MALALTVGAVDQTEFIAAQSMSLKFNTFDFALFDPATIPDVDDVVTLTDPAWAGTVRSVTITDTVELGAHITVAIAAVNEDELAGDTAPFGLSDEPDDAATFGYAHLSIKVAHNSDDTTETSGTLTCFEPGLLPGMAFELTSANRGYSAVSFDITNVVTTWPSLEAAPEFQVTFGSTVTTFTDWVGTVGGGGGGATSTPRPGGVINDGDPLGAAKVDWYYVTTSAIFFATDPVAWVADTFYDPGALISEGGFWFTREPDQSRLSTDGGSEPDWGSAVAGDSVPDGGGYWYRLPDAWDPTDTVPAWTAATSFERFVRANGGIYIGSGPLLEDTGASEPLWVNDPCAGHDTFFVIPEQGDPDPIYSLSRAYVPGSITAYNNGVPISALSILEYAPAQGLVTITSKDADDDVIVVDFSAVC